MALYGQFLRHTKQEAHLSLIYSINSYLFISTIFAVSLISHFSFIITMASFGQTFLHFPQKIHFSLLIFINKPLLS